MEINCLPACIVAVLMEAHSGNLEPRRFRFTEAFHERLCDTFNCTHIWSVFGVPVETIPDHAPAHLLAASREFPLAGGGVCLIFDDRESLALPTRPRNAQIYSIPAA